MPPFIQYISIRMSRVDLQRLESEFIFNFIAFSLVTDHHPAVVTTMFEYVVPLSTIAALSDHNRSGNSKVLGRNEKSHI